MVGDNKNQNKTKNNKLVLEATLAPSSSWAELQAGAKVDQKQKWKKNKKQAGAELCQA